MKKSLAIAAVAVTMLSGCQTSTNAQDFPLGPVLGGVAGGFIGNQFGKGTGKTAATALGAVGGYRKLLNSSRNSGVLMVFSLP